MRAIGLLLLVLAALTGPAQAAAARLEDPWPDPASVQGVRVEAVRFPSSSPFNPQAAIGGHAPAATAIATLYLPPVASAAHPVPAAILLHGAAGFVRERAATYGPPMAALGVAVLVIDTFGSRPEMGRGFAARLIHITETMQVADAYAGLRWLATRPEIDAHRVALIGFSYGGMSTQFAMQTLLADALAPPGLRFAAHVSFYAPCIARFAQPHTTGAPLLMLYGGKDELIRPDRCEEIAQDLRRGGSAVTIIAYPEAVHEWDGPLARRMIGRDLTPCRFEVQPDGTVLDRRLGLPMSGPILRAVELFACVRNQPYPIGHDDRVTAASNRDLGRFLEAVLKPG
jgi:dienelactone hydrolase